MKNLCGSKFNVETCVVCESKCSSMKAENRAHKESCSCTIISIFKCICVCILSLYFSVCSCVLYFTFVFVLVFEVCICVRLVVNQRVV